MLDSRPCHKIHKIYKNPGISGNRYNQRGQDKPRQQYQSKNYQGGPNTGAQAATTGSGEKGQGLDVKETGGIPKNKEGYYYKGNSYRR